MTEAKQQEAGRTRFLLLPPLSAAEREAERESERKLSVVLVEMFGSKGNYNAVIATRTEPAQKGPLEPGADITAPARPPHLLPYFEDVDSGYLHWVLLNIDNDQVRATARYHLDLRAARDQGQRRPAA